MIARVRPHAAACIAALLLAACVTEPPTTGGTRPQPPSKRALQFPPPQVSVVVPGPPPQQLGIDEKPGPARTDESDGPPDPDSIPANLANLVEPVPREEPLSRSGNPDAYEVFGKKYRVLTSSRGYRETGLASWYGRKFHGHRTSNGETYDMFKLTAAHKTLPLPTYVRVTNLANGKSVVVRVNDRGPFHKSRIIDLSFAAATKLETVGKIAMVELEAITPGKELPPPPKALEALEQQQVPEARFTMARALQVAAYSDPINAVSMKDELEQLGLAPVTIRVGQLDNGDTVHRVIVGPFEERQKMDEARIRIRGAGYEAIPVHQ